MWWSLHLICVLATFKEFLVRIVHDSGNASGLNDVSPVRRRDGRAWWGAMEVASRTQTPWYCVPQSSTSHYHTIFTAFLRKPPLEFSVLLVLLTPNLGFKDFLTKRADKCVARTASRIWFTTASLSFQLDLKDCQNFVIGFLDILQIVSSSELY